MFRKLMMTGSILSMMLAVPAVAQETAPAAPAEKTPLATEAENALEATGEAADAVGNVATSAAESAAESVGEAAEQTGDAASEVIQDLTATDAPDAGVTEPDAVANDPAGTDPMVPTDPALAVPPLVPVDLAQVTAEDLTGADLRNNTNETLGEVEDVTLDSAGQIDALIVGFGGFLGFGEKTVLIPVDRIEVMSRGEGDVTVVTDLTPEALDEMPEYNG